MSAVVNQKQRNDVVAEPQSGESRVTPVMPAPTWPRELGNEPLPTSNTVQHDADEHQFWDSAPRYSVTNLASLAPPLPGSPSYWRVWSARLLFVMIFSAVAALLGLEMKSIGAPAPLTLARAVRAFLSSSP